MYLKKLSAQGFKSFANRTTFEFGPGITSIVGPNGSGKSNVADALRWVLGEQSSRLLRAKKQEDIIFAGTKDRPAVGMAEVILTLDNEDRWLPVDFAEVEVGRRIYRNGDSEYLLNGSRVRLRDVVDLLMKGDVGQNSYSIMGQGLVDEVLSMTPEERRNFLDEAADVKRFRVKIKEAQDRLAATRDNIDRVTLIVSEIQPRLAQLSRQAERAAEHRRLSAELMDLLRAYYGHRWSEAENAVVRARAALDQRSAEDASAATRVEQLREQIRALGDEIRKRREAIARRDARSSDIEHRLMSTEQGIALDRERHALITARRDEVRVELESLEAERMSLSTADLEEDRETAIAADAEAAKALALECRDALESSERDYAALRSRAQELRDGADADDLRLGGLDADTEGAGRRIAELERESEALAGRRRQLLVELISYGRRFAELSSQLIAAEREAERARRVAEDTRTRLLRVQEEVRNYESGGNRDLRQLDRLEGRLEALRRIQVEHDGVASGTRHVLIMGHKLLDGVEPGDLGEPPELPGVIGLLARQLRVPSGLEVAVNAALETRLHAILIESESAALNAIDMLRQRRQGRAQFVPLDGLRHVYPLNLQKEKGVVGVASKLVRCDNRVRPLIDTLLGRVIIVEDPQTGLRMIRRGLGSVVTLDGTYIEQTGVLTGGATGADEGVFARQRELEDLPERINELRSRTAVANQQLDNAHAAIRALSLNSGDAEADYDAIRRELQTARAELERERDRLHRLRRDLESVRVRNAGIARDREAAERLIAQASQAEAHLSARRDERRAAIDALQEELRWATERREAALAAFAEASGRVAAVEGERKAVAALREQHDRAIERLASQVAAKDLQATTLEHEATVIEERLARLALDLEAIRAEQARYSDDAAPDRDELHRFENHERQVQDEYAQAQADLLNVDRRRLDIEAELNRALEHVEALRLEMEREGLAPDRTGKIVPIESAVGQAKIPTAAAPAVQGGSAIDVEETRTRIDEVRRHIRRLGPINEEAPEDFEESQERYEFLTTQLKDLTDAEVQLRQAIAELNEEIRARFTTTFETVNKSFGDYFTAFFGGGSASLSLTDPSNLAEAGIEIEAQPPGKRLRTLSLLSGGERSLTAVALLFALLTANPAPFCVLDEVDAALDEANVGRFTTALAKLAERTQFIVVTHNRRTIEVADAIYGVSMGRDGVSKVLSLRLADLPQHLN